MKFFPECSEGIRRVSIVSALLTFILLFGWWSYARSRQDDSWNRLCYDTSEAIRDNCHNSNRSDTQSCDEKAKKDEFDCFRVNSLSDSLIDLGLRTVGALFWSYLIALSVRTMGWV